jgi:hypothetical protein
MRQQNILSLRLGWGGSERTGLDHAEAAGGVVRRRYRSFIGAVVTLVFVLAYALGAMLVAQAGPMRDAPPLLQGFLYVVLGLAWIFPLMPLVRWMTAPDE